MTNILRKLVQLNEAINYIVKEIRIELNIEKKPIYDSLGYMVAKDIISPVELPFFNRSAVDGYAVRAEDTYGASDFNPIVLRIMGEITRSTVTDISIRMGEAVKIYTGMPLPNGANAVVMFEDVIINGDKLYVTKSISKYANVALRGEDIQNGRIIIKRGTVIEPKHILAISAIGIDNVEVYEKIKTCLICIGSELVEPGAMDIEEVIAKGLTYNSTGPLLLSYMKALGFIEPIYIGVVVDDINEVARLIKEAVKTCHIVITTGGAGPSDYDVAINAIDKVSGKIIVRGIAIRPGRPTSAGIVNGKPIFILSGFPVASFLGFKFFVLPVLEKSIGVTIPRKTIVARLSKRVSNIAGYTSFVRVRLYKFKDTLYAEPIAITGSGTISTVLDSDGILVVPADIEGFNEGQYVWIELF